MSEKPQISVVIPAKDESESLPELCEWIARVMKANAFTYEVIVIDDGSTDDSWDVIQQISQKNPAVKGLQFNRNYGKSAALHVGFRSAAGHVVITMDADLQDSPDEIPELYAMITQQKYDLVSGWKKKRYDPISKTIPTKLFNGVTRWISGIQLHDFNCGLKAYNSRVTKNIEVYGEMHRYIPLIAKWSGFSKIGEKVVEHRARKYGHTKFGLERFVFGFLDLLSISFVTRYRKRPMHFFGTIGSLSFLFGAIVAIWLIIDKAYNNIYLHKTVRSVTDQPLFFVGLVAIILGAQTFLAGFLGEMLTTSNPQKANDYLVADKVGF
ncbi:glycosyltransferase family 2 protein [Cytophagaceae bacterium DM2B3-1]|uniref:Glycosyltransferase family 2 protein n=1 Tax=Xanthocytophaga flava TaxID=3048013 RepID=A0ABT7CEH9_9BACT|nr:glycosyltransferase family 2 protein [Xanthocytophaga flavus]MDJ1468957.1 glycosyltransferase family 2 protein [Xanthocytophaga flavus]MDJ1492131.1 glycosyltransferase family 2 protein [Xanthocytophaga flavus]